MALSRTDIAWIAGIIDGEGSLGLYFYSKGKDRKRKSLKPSLAIYNNDFAIIHRAYNILIKFGHCRITGRLNPHGNHRFHLQTVNYQTLLNFLPKVNKYLTSKKANAELLLDYIKWRQNCGATYRGKGRRISDQDQDKLRYFHERTKELNSGQRGDAEKWKSYLVQH